MKIFKQAKLSNTSYKYIFGFLFLLNCGIAIVDPIPSYPSMTGGDGGSLTSSSIQAGSSSESSTSSGGGSEPCTPGQFIPGSDGGSDGGLSLCCEDDKTLCINICCEQVTYKPDGSKGPSVLGGSRIDQTEFCTGNFELGYCCPNNFTCIPH